jgi:isoleucyl-tRNA synthetase
VLGNDGQKMSKSLRNYPDVNEVFDRYGSDAMRWFLMASPILRGGNLIVTEQGIKDAVRQAILPLWNSYYFFALYANAESYQARHSIPGEASGGRGPAATGGQASEVVSPQGRSGGMGPPGNEAASTSEHVLDRYILAKTRVMVTELAELLDAYNVGGACQLLREHLEVLTNWYIRRSRSRFWAGEPGALDTLWTVLETVCRAAAPLLPLTTEAIWRGLTGEPSVHLAAWPDVSAWPQDAGLTGAMDLVRAVCSTALGIRKASALRVRLPLASLVIAHPDAKSLAPFAELIADEVNVKTVELSDEVASLGTFELAVNPRLLGPRLGAQVQQVIRAVKAGDWVRSGERVIAAGIELEPGEYELRLAATDPGSTAAVLASSSGGTRPPGPPGEGTTPLALPPVAAGRRPPGPTAAMGNAGLVALDTRVTPELAAEGTARDVVRIVQQARRDAGLSVSDRIRLTIGADGAAAEAVRAHAGFVAAETLAVSLDVRPAGEIVGAEPQPAGDGLVRVTVTKEPSAP